MRDFAMHIDMSEALAHAMLRHATVSLMQGLAIGGILAREQVATMIERETDRLGADVAHDLALQARASHPTNPAEHKWPASDDMVISRETDGPAPAWVLRRPGHESRYATPEEAFEAAYGPHSDSADHHVWYVAAPELLPQYIPTVADYERHKRNLDGRRA